MIKSIYNHKKLAIYTSFLVSMTGRFSSPSVSNDANLCLCVSVDGKIAKNECVLSPSRGGDGQVPGI
jgi:hypothetical protein